MEMEEAIDKILDSLVYVRVIGRGGNNHIGFELTVKMLHESSVDDTLSRTELKDFLLQAIAQGESDA